MGQAVRTANDPMLLCRLGNGGLVRSRDWGHGRVVTPRRRQNKPVLTSRGLGSATDRLPADTWASLTCFLTCEIGRVTRDKEPALRIKMEMRS